jgi:8-amino-7-oxononanoate synthase
MTSITAIQPVLVPGASRVLAASEALRQRGFWVSAIRYPTVPAGSERLRVTLSAAHSDAQVESLLDALAQCVPAAEVAINQAAT